MKEEVRKMIHTMNILRIIGRTTIKVFGISLILFWLLVKIIYRLIITLTLMWNY